MRSALEPLLDDPPEAAIVCDYDGTLSPIVDDPKLARPVPGVVDVLGELAGEFGVVAVVSGRPLAFLAEQLEGVSSDVELAGLYGLERRGPGGVVVEPAAADWVPAVREATERLQAEAPAGVLVEDKRLSVTVHWRRAPEAAGWAERAVRAEAALTGLRPQPGKMSIELRPPLAVDKGTALRELADDAVAALYLGDDTGDLPAFAALAALGTERGMATVAGVVAGAETPLEVVAAADLVLEGPEQARDLLVWMAHESRWPAV